MKILMTGGTGFIGRHLKPLLKKAGHNVHFLVRQKTGLEHEWEWDFNSPLSENLPPYDVIIHLASYVDFGKGFEVEQYRVNTLATFALAEFAQKNNASMIFSSMAGVHGNSKNISALSPIAPANHYAMSKYLAEEIVRRVCKKYVILRIAGVYGYSGPKHLKLNAAITEAVDLKRIPTLSGSGSAKRNYICVLDAGKWIEELVSQIEKDKSVPRILYMAGKEIFSIKEYLLMLADIILSSPKILEKEGDDGQDSVIKGDPAPFFMISFEDYLRGLNQNKGNL